MDCRKTQSLFRGENDWLQTVLSHELSHAFSLRVLNPPIVVGTSIGVSSSAENFSVAATHYWGINAMPLWFIEGISQLGSLVNKRRKTTWYQRLSLGAKIEAGLVQYCSSGPNLGFPLSVEASLRQYFYLSPNRESLVYLKAGVPLINFMGTITLPFQIYAGYSSSRPTLPACWGQINQVLGRLQEK